MSRIWKAEVGTCQGCRREQRLDDGRHVVEHMRWHDHRCSGSGKLCTEAQAANAEVSRTKAMARIDRLRIDAAVAHDALLSCGPNPYGGSITENPFPAHRILALRSAALQEYRFKFPKARQRRLWFMADRRRTRRSKWGPALGDVYCTLCRELLLQKVTVGGDHTERTREHTTLCAMKRLAGMAEYVAPGEKRLPAEALQQSERL